MWHIYVEEYYQVGNMNKIGQMQLGYHHDKKNWPDSERQINNNFLSYAAFTTTTTTTPPPHTHTP